MSNITFRARVVTKRFKETPMEWVCHHNHLKAVGAAKCGQTHLRRNLPSITASNKYIQYESVRTDVLVHDPFVNPGEGEAFWWDIDTYRMHVNHNLTV